jgi:uncharacterized protein with HEPN domain
MRRDELYLRDMVDAIDRILSRVKGRDFATGMGDADAQDVILHRLMIIGEAASRASADLRSRYPDVQWKRATNLRNRVAHDYFGIDWGIVWSTINDDLPTLRVQVLGQI